MSIQKEKVVAVCTCVTMYEKGVLITAHCHFPFPQHWWRGVAWGRCWLSGTVGLHLYVPTCRGY